MIRLLVPIEKGVREARQTNRVEQRWRIFIVYTAKCLL